LSEAAVIIGTGVVFFLVTCWAIIDIARKDFGGIEKKGDVGGHYADSVYRSGRLFLYRLPQR
jgi:hypothetical protein